MVISKTDAGSCCGNDAGGATPRWSGDATCTAPGVIGRLASSTLNPGWGIMGNPDPTGRIAEPCSCDPPEVLKRCYRKEAGRSRAIWRGETGRRSVAQTTRSGAAIAHKLLSAQAIRRKRAELMGSLIAAFSHSNQARQSL